MVATEYPWPENSGSRMRLAATLEALGHCGEVELFCAVSQTRRDFEPPPPTPALARHLRLAIDDRPPGPADLARCLVHPDAPFEMPLRAQGPVGRALGRFVHGAYDLVWFFQVRAWVLAHAALDASAPVVVDIDDLEDQKILARAALPPRPPQARGWLRHGAGSLWTVEDVRRWRRLHRTVAQRAAATVVCSELDARRAALPGVRVVRNGYRPPAHPVGRAKVGDPPVVVFQGTLRYAPNADAARFLVEDVGPRLRRLVPHVQVRLVGLPSPALAALDDPPAVVLTGQVPDITDELSRADLVVIPLRYASGTRVKILEAFAHRIPVVSTTMGAEGLEVTAGTHLLVADNPDAVAQACARLLEDDRLRQAVVDQAHALFVDRYRSAVVQREVVALAHEVAAR